MKAIRADFKALFEQYEAEFLADLKAVLRVPSVRGVKTYQAPFGIGPKRALETVLSIATRMGFRTGQVGDCVGWAEYGPAESQAPTYFGILGHLDVVDVEDDWHYPPFDLTQVDNFLYGRGVLDNKGPLLSTLFALYLIKTQKITFKHRVRIIFGMDEESGSQDIPLYLQQEAAPSAGFTPDCKFPAVYGERGLLDVQLSLPITDGSERQITAIDGQFAKSYLPDHARLLLADGTVKTYQGQKAPSNAPEMADNVLPKLVADASRLTGQTGQFYQWLNAKIGNQSTGENLGINFEDAASGALQLAFYGLSIEAQQLSCHLTCRYPISVTEEQLVAGIEAALLPGMTVTVKRRYPSQVTNPQLPFIQQLSAIYAADTGLDGTPVTTTGVTYARALPNIIAFGPSFPGQKGIAHKGDEWLQFSDWQMMMQIYYDSLLVVGTQD
ncbi:Sapep family Mn(2+)-dependent dipeptidase [Latilactobacillus sakei]|uniref:Sapep family Mn(2+)-dependent dipeptidase n=1 Tax=Latilactobacillus sakei TaxID=1599 RepID=UPI000DCAC611|nr:Sapep family Mn(2+)-dependent dipeptidase [Latilactobacillus sakei]AWZ44900.1 peptidase M20 [Latilactobacillus sakei]